MDLPPPTIATPTTGPPPPGPRPTHAPPPSSRHPLSAAGWLATTGSTLLLVASIVVVAGNWQSITPEARFAGLVAALFAVYFAAETVRLRVPLTALSLATLAPLLTAPVGIAAAATIDQPWPVCITVGGGLALVATELQSRRWKRRALQASTVISAGLTATGIAALTGIPVGIVAAVAAVLFAVTGAERRSIVTGVAAAIAPVVQVLTVWDIGPGTIARLGVSGSVLAWAAPTAATIGAVVIAVAAQRRQDLLLVATAAATCVVGFVISSTEIDLAAPIRLALPALVLILLEAVEALAGATIWRRAARSALAVVMPPVVITAACSGGLLFALDGAEWSRWAGTIAVFTVATWTALAGAARRALHDDGLASIFVAGCSSTFAAEAAIFGFGLGLTDVAVVAGFAATAWLIGHNRVENWRHGAAVLGSVAVGLTAPAAGAAATETAMVLFGLVIASSVAAFRRDRRGPADTFAIALSVALLGAAAVATPLVLSVSLALAASQGTMYLIAAYRPQYAAVTGAIAVTSIGSVWWTSGANDLAISWLHPLGADGVDLALAAAALSTTALGHLVRTRHSMSSWLAYGPGLGMATAWLIPAQVDATGTWATVTGLAVGIGMIGVGGARRLAAPLVMGTVLLIATIIISIGERLSTAPVWLWMAAGGAGLLALAAVIERTDRPLLASSSQDDRSSLFEWLRDDFG